MTPELLTSIRELDIRTSDGLQVQLLWCQDNDRVFVAVNDQKTGEAFSVEVPEGERALHVFDHPYAYAAQPGCLTSGQQLHMTATPRQPSE